MPYKFPKNFYWGAATSAHQVEGNNHNDWTEWEVANAERLSKESGGKYLPENYISGKACDHYNRFREDFDIAKSLGHNAHRFSIEWSRIEPEEGKWDEKEIEHYRDVIRALRERGIEPFVTLWHWTNPLWIRDTGGWENPKTADYFVRYVEKIVKEYPEVKYWLTINEPTVYIGLGYVQGTQPPWVKKLSRANTVHKNLVKAHKLSYITIHKNSKNALVGFPHHLVYMAPKNNMPWTKLAVLMLEYIRNWRFVNSVKNHYDFFGVQFYQSQTIGISLGGKWGFFSVSPTSGKPLDDLGWAINPEGLYYLLKKSSRYSKPIYVTESGLADARDIYRPKFIEDTLNWISKAIKDGVDVRGYFHWTFMDNYELPELRGFWARFGLIEIDFKTLKRKIRPSALKYKALIKDSK